jgi:predicted AlkP superfamily phosphohydrolase/phosphomutase
MWLLNNGFLVFKNDLYTPHFFHSLLSSLGLNKERLLLLYKKYARLVRIFFRQEEIILRGLGQHFFDEDGEIGITALLEKIDWNKTKAIVLGEGLLYITAPSIEKNEYEQLRATLIEQIENVREPKTNEAIATVVKREELYKGPYLDSAPDLVVVPLEGYLVNDYLSRVDRLWSYSKRKFSACHQQNGIFLAYGFDIRKGEQIDGATIYDIAPTILHLFQVPIPNDIDGTALRNIFNNNSKLRNSHHSNTLNPKEKYDSNLTL